MFAILSWIQGGGLLPPQMVWEIHKGDW